MQNTKSQIRKKALKSLLYCRIKVLRKIYRKGMNSLEENVDEIEELLYNIQIKQLNYEYNIQISELVGKQEKEQYTEIKEQQKILKERAKREVKIEKEKEIREYIEKRFALDTTNSKRVFNSLLE